MDRIRSYEQYKELLARLRAEGCKQSNCFFLPEAARQKAESGCLSLLPARGGAVLLEDGGGFYRCYYFFPDGARPEPLRLDRPAVIELPFRGQTDDAPQEQVRMIGRMGFRLGRESVLMTADAGEIVDRDLPAGLPPAESAEASETEEILRLLNDSFDPLYAFLPSPEELRGAIGEERVLVIRQKDGISAVLNSGLNRQTASIHHVAVAPAARDRAWGRRSCRPITESTPGRLSAFSTGRTWPIGEPWTCTERSDTVPAFGGQTNISFPEGPVLTGRRNGYIVISVNRKGKNDH